jgi:uncharacterized protein YerC
VLADLKHPKQVREFLTAFLTETELTVLSKRLAILSELENKASYDTIKDKLKVSSATISTVAEQRQETGLQLALKIIDQDQKLDFQLQKWFGWLFQTSK